MKKVLFSLLSASALLCSTSCADEAIAPAGEGEAMVNFTVQLNDGNASRAISDGLKATQLFYEVYAYDKDGAKPTAIDKVTTMVEKNGKLTAEVGFPLVKGQKYDIVFWAQKKGAYVTDVADKLTTINMFKENTTTYANDDTRDAFTAVYSIEKVEGAQSHVVELNRPFAQVNFATTTDDIQDALEAGLNLESKQSKVLVKNVATQYNALTKAATGNQDVYTTFNWNTVPANETLLVKTQGTETTEDDVTYNYLATAYVLVPGVDKQSLADLEMELQTGLNENINLKVPAAPVQRNYRTNVLGNLLTNQTDFTVEIDADFNTPDTEIANVMFNGKKYETWAAAMTEFAKSDVVEGEIVLISNLEIDADETVLIPAGKTLTLNLNGQTLNGVSDQTGSNRNIFDVRGTMNVEGGLVAIKHEGQNMGWNNSTNVFNVTAGGVLNIKNATVENYGGSDMAFAAHLNNWGEVTLNVENSTLKFSYIAVRVFNSGPDKNNVTIKNSTLEGKYSFWVHNYTAADFGTEAKAEAQKALLNFDMYNPISKNTFIAKDEAKIILFGFTNSVYVDQYGRISIENIADGVTKDQEDGSYYISNAAGLKWVADIVNSTAPYTPTLFDNKLVKLTNDIDLNNEEWIPIGDDRSQRTEFHGIFDGQGCIIRNIKITKKTDIDDGNKSSYGLFGNLKGTVKNLTVENVSISGAPKFIGALVGRMNDGLVENCHVKNSSVECNNWTIGGLVGQLNNGKISGCTVENTAVKGYAAVGGITGIALNTGERVIENCTVTNCTLVKNGSFGGNFDKMFGGIVGALYSGELTVNLNNCKVENTTIEGVESSKLCGYVSEGDKLYINGAVVASSTEELEAALKDGENVTLANDIVMTKTLALNNADFTLDGNGYTISQAVECSNTYALFDITGGKATIKNVVFDGVKEGAVVRTVGVEFNAENVIVQNGNHTQQQGLFRLMGKSTIKNSTFKNNTCNMVVTLNYDGGNNDPQVVENCVFENNTCNATAVLYYVKGAGATIKGNKFVGNTVNCSANGATVYMGFTENNVITNNLFQNNTVNEAGTSKRVAGGLMLGYEAVVTGNAFIGNTVTGANAKGNDVCASVYYTDIDLSGNYWGGNAPVENDDYFVEYPEKNQVIINDYLTVNSIK